MIEGILLGLSVAAPIGPTNVELVRRGMKGGFWACILFAAGVEIALLTYLFAVFAGLSFLTEIGAVNVLLSLFGVAVLFFLGYTSIKDYFDRDTLDLKSSADDRHLLSGIVLTLSNPAVLLFWSGIIGANLATKESNITNNVLISSGILIGVSVWFVGLSALLYAGRRYVTPRVFRYVSGNAGIVLIGFGLSFGYRLVLVFS